VRVLPSSVPLLQREGGHAGPSAPLLAGLTALLVLSSCTGTLVTPEPEAQVGLVLTAPAGALQNVARVTVTVSGPGMDSMTKDLTIQGNQATGTLTVPAGQDRTFSVQALDAQGTVLASGSRTIDLEAGSSPTVSIALDIPTEQELYYDDGTPDYEVSLADWDGLGAEFSASGAAAVTAVKLYLWDAGNFLLVVADDPPPAWGSTQVFTVEPSSAGWITLDFSGYPVSVSGEFFVAIVWYDEEPSLGWDQQDCGCAWGMPIGASEWQSLGGTPFIRVVIEGSGP
jgi:hypothetical protein